jgi:hypothetical protein
MRYYYRVINGMTVITPEKRKQEFFTGELLTKTNVLNYGIAPELVEYVKVAPEDIHYSFGVRFATRWEVVKK